MILRKINTDALRGLIFTKYKSQAEFARSIEWHPNKVSAMLNDAYVPDVNEAAMLYEKLDMTIKQYISIFLPNTAPNGDKLANQSA